MMKGIIVVYLVLSVIEYFYFVGREKAIAREIAYIPAGDMEFYEFEYPNKMLLKGFLPAYLAVSMRMHLGM